MFSTQEAEMEGCLEFQPHPSSIVPGQPSLQKVKTNSIWNCNNCISFWGLYTVTIKGRMIFVQFVCKGPLEKDY